MRTNVGAHISEAAKVGDHFLMLYFPPFFPNSRATLAFNIEDLALIKDRIFIRFLDSGAFTLVRFHHYQIVFPLFFGVFFTLHCIVILLFLLLLISRLGGSWSNHLHCSEFTTLM